MRNRTTHIVTLAIAALLLSGVGATAFAGGPPAPPLTTGSGGNGGGPTSTGGPTITGGSTNTGGGTTTSTSTSKPQYPPAAATHLTASHAKPNVIALTWQIPASKAIHAVIVRRGVGLDCPTSATDGAAVGGQSVRRAQTDKNVKPGGRYCYSVFTAGTYGSRPGVHTSLIASPPAAVSGVIAGVRNGHVLISWKAASGAVAYTVVANSTRCANSVQDGRVVAKTPGRVATDKAAVTGTPNCYVVFASDRFANFSVPAQADKGQMVGLKTVAASQPGSGSPASASASSSSGLSSSLTRIVAIVGIAVLLLAAVATLLVRVMNRRRDDWQYSSGRDSGRVALSDYSTGALVIPAVIALIGFALLVAVAVSL